MAKVTIYLSVIVMLCALNFKYFKHPVSSEDFAYVMGRQGFEIMDMTREFTQTSAKVVKTALSDTNAVEYYSFDTIDNAQTAYDMDVKMFGTAKSASVFEETKQGLNFSSYKYITQKGYYFVSRVDRVVIFIKSSSAHRQTLDMIVQALDLW